VPHNDWTTDDKLRVARDALERIRFEMRPGRASYPIAEYIYDTANRAIDAIDNAPPTFAEMQGAWADKAPDRPAEDVVREMRVEEWPGPDDT
jgi:hypothetical protein